jgi:hypothetical protein
MKLESFSDAGQRRKKIKSQYEEFRKNLKHG